MRYRRCSGEQELYQTHKQLTHDLLAMPNLKQAMLAAPKEYVRNLLVFYHCQLTMLF